MMKKRNSQPPTASSQAIAAALEREIAPEQLAAALADGLRATITSRSGVREIDYRTRLQAASMVLAYQVGRPREAPEAPPIPKQSLSDEEVMADLRRSPALRKGMRSMIEEAERSAADGD